MAIDVKQLQTIIDNLVTQEMRDFANTPDADKNRLRPIDADLQVPDTTKFKKHTGWEPQIKFEQTMNDLLDYWRTRISSGRKFLRR